MNQSNSKSSRLTLKLPDETSTADPATCAEALNKYFHNQFCQDDDLPDIPLPLDNEHPLEVTAPGVKTLILNLKNNKSPGPDSIRKCELLIDPILVAECLARIFNVSIAQGKLPTA